MKNLKMKKEDKLKQSKIIKKTNFYTKCKNCGHSRDWHEIGDIIYTQIFGIKLGECTHYTKDYTLPFWKRRKVYCKCKKFKT